MYEAQGPLGSRHPLLLLRHEIQHLQRELDNFADVGLEELFLVGEGGGGAEGGHRLRGEIEVPVIALPGRGAVGAVDAPGDSLVIGQELAGLARPTVAIVETAFDGGLVAAEADADARVLGRPIGEIDIFHFEIQPPDIQFVPAGPLQWNRSGDTVPR